MQKKYKDGGAEMAASLKFMAFLVRIALKKLSSPDLLLFMTVSKCNNDNIKNSTKMRYPDRRVGTLCRLL